MGKILVKKGRKLHIYAEKNIKSWNFIQVSYFRRETWGWHPFSLELNIWPIWGQFGVKGSLKGQKLPFSSQMSIKSWLCPGMVFETRNVMGYPFSVYQKNLNLLRDFSGVERGKKVSKTTYLPRNECQILKCSQVSYLREETL